MLARWAFPNSRPHFFIDPDCHPAYHPRWRKMDFSAENPSAWWWKKQLSTCGRLSMDGPPPGLAACAHRRRVGHRQERRPARNFDVHRHAAGAARRRRGDGQSRQVPCHKRWAEVTTGARKEVGRRSVRRHPAEARRVATPHLMESAVLISTIAALTFATAVGWLPVNCDNTPCKICWA